MVKESEPEAVPLSLQAEEPAARRVSQSEGTACAKLKDRRAPLEQPLLHTHSPLFLAQPDLFADSDKWALESQADLFEPQIHYRISMW